MAKKTIHIVPKEQGWIIKKEGAQRISGSADTKAEAYVIAKQIALNQGLDIIVHGKNGKIQKKIRPQESDEGCFITTACVKYWGLKDNCYQLQTLRKFRDNHLLKSSDTKSLVHQYYIIAPQIVRCLESDKNKSKLYKTVFQHINNACTAIEKGEFVSAKNIYIKIVLQLLTYFKLPHDGCKC